MCNFHNGRFLVGSSTLSMSGERAEVVSELIDIRVI